MDETGTEIRRLRDCISGLMSLLALPSLWDGRDPLSILRTLLDMLGRMLALDLAYARLDKRRDCADARAGAQRAPT